jgi:hypothetical protein
LINLESQQAGLEWSAVKMLILILFENSPEEPLVSHNTLAGLS